jgi:hypothetical protein
MQWAWRNEKCGQIFIGKLHMIRTLGGCSCRWENNIKMAIQKYVVEGLQNAE